MKLWLLSTLFFVTFPFLNGLSATIGECPVLIDEPCNSSLVTFSLSYKLDKKLKHSTLDPFKPKLPKGFKLSSGLKIVIHGYGGLKIDTASTNVSFAYQTAGYNVITVDWEPLGNLPCYATAAINTWHVAQCISILTVSLMALGLSAKKLHLIGFSLGAHIAGFTGMQLQELAGILVDRITGLDPALPLFATLNNKWKLDPSDANFVDVIHTSAGTFGKVEASGHIDFYVNGGSLQPICYNARYPPLCSHITAGLYFAASISKKNKFVGIECSNVANYMLGICSTGKMALMGEHLNRSITGIYYVDTGSKYPYALDQTTFAFFFL